MGGDFAPREIVKGAVLAARTDGTNIILVGPKDRLKAELSDCSAGSLPITIHHNDDFIREGEPPTIALRQRPGVSIAVATGLVKTGHADAVVSMGPTGGVMAAAALLLGTLEGVERPVVGGPFLGFAPQTVVVDLGATVDCKPHQLLSFAVLGCGLARFVLGIPNPTVALLSSGTEEGKGNRQVKEAYELFKESSLNFIGNVEGIDLPRGKANVVVCDGFVGNILFKLAEGLGAAVADYIRSRADSLPQADLENLAAEVFHLTNPGERMGGPLLGINGVSVVGHGRSTAKAVAGAIAIARLCVEIDLVGGLSAELSRVGKILRT